MNLTSRSRYAIKIMLDLAKHTEEPLVRRQDIVKRQGVPAKYLDQILVRLRKAGLVDSIRGRTGGYRVGRKLDSITLWDIFHAVEDGIYPVACVDEHEACRYTASCVASGPWQLIFDTLRSQLEGMTLIDLANRYAVQEKMCPMAGIRECKQGREPVRV
ncbi:RrF2 family transcriptional regulator [Pseudobacteriovorax antillogorgiicola]|uniref:Transcriptional regulator, BadM/Rrf2 family n=1 Tax=Pseudobacteriovorax antillogorgiicola TaxID=1513793 RepID=A0A1Y6C7J7_9BACT|nr:Rrf2 family transcriptional regulator [Pseudobacteriovorax antillogorgiicola]TCS49387.1 BadM/Rrf2 family transcriptional regulator [Pseudobacteriovorax antillogorgiicola]SMF47226.1 transcriptional regulator, BadM/Rrf2 family [Pseudobacteriovorax antillogorgiicola]